MALKLEIDDSSTPDSQSFSYPSSASSSFSACSFANDGPFTPTTGRSSPPERPSSVDFDLSFCSHSYDMTPPPTSSGYFPVEFKPAMDTGFMSEALTTTPSRYTNLLDVPLSSQECMGHLTPQHDIVGMYPFSEGLSASPFMFPTPTQLVHSRATVEMSDLWSLQGQTESTVTFFEDQPPTLKSMTPVNGEDLAFNFNTTRRRLFIGEVQQKTNQLHRPQLRSQAPLRTRVKHEKVIMSRSGIHVQRIAAGEHKCDVPGCPSKPFKRMEHLKRHQNTHHKGQNSEEFPCDFCERKFNRRDNWRQHLKLHTEKRGRNARTFYCEQAVKDYEEEMSRIKQRRRSSKATRRAALTNFK